MPLDVVGGLLVAACLGSLTTVAYADVPAGHYKVSRWMRGISARPDKTPYPSCESDSEQVFTTIAGVDGYLRPGGLWVNHEVWRVKWWTPDIVAVLHPESSKEREVMLVIAPPVRNVAEIQLLVTRFDARRNIVCSDAMTYRGTFSRPPKGLSSKRARNDARGAAKIMTGKTLAELDLTETVPRLVSVKEVVFRSYSRRTARPRC